MPNTSESYFLDKISYKISDYLVPILSKYKIHPNIVTLVGFVPLFMSYSFILKKNRFLAFLFGFINFTFDCIDGELARYDNKQSKLGGLLDTIHDVVTYITVLYPILSYYTILIVFLTLFFTTQILKHDIITHEANNKSDTMNNITNYLHDYLSLIYYILIQISILFV